MSKEQEGMTAAFHNLMETPGPSGGESSEEFLRGVLERTDLLRGLPKGGRDGHDIFIENGKVVSRPKESS